MCLILLAYHVHPAYRLILAANRDEFYSRPAAPLDYWPDNPQILAGRDLAGNGTWMGITRSGRLAAITNFRDPSTIKASAPSRGHLVSDFLAGEETPAEYLSRVRKNGDAYNGFNLIVGNADTIFYFSNRGQCVEQMTPGIHGLSNHLLDTDWPKVSNGKTMLANLIQESQVEPDALFNLLIDRTIAPDDLLPDTGVDRHWERVLSAMFITSPGYGTRCSSVLTIGNNGEIDFFEKSWRSGSEQPEVETAQRFRFVIPDVS